MHNVSHETLERSTKINQQSPSAMPVNLEILLAHINYIRVDCFVNKNSQRGHNKRMKSKTCNFEHGFYTDYADVHGFFLSESA